MTNLLAVMLLVIGVATAMLGLTRWFAWRWECRQRGENHFRFRPDPFTAGLPEHEDAHDPDR